VDGGDTQPELVGERGQAVGVLGRRVLRDHHLDRVEASVRDGAKRLPERLPEERRRREEERWTCVHCGGGPWAAAILRPGILAAA
jgi:hypothetical protein